MSGQWRFPISSLITGLSIYMLTRTRFTVVPYLVAAVVAIGSKYVFRTSKGHVFNPANVGILTAFAFLPHLALPGADQWAGTPQLLILFYLIGLSVAGYAKRLPLALSYMGVLLSLTLLRSMFSELSVFYLLGPTLGTAGVIFAFHMITDPKTTPSSYKQQIVMGTVVALLDCLLRCFEVFYAPFIALAVVSGLYNIWIYAATDQRTSYSYPKP